MKYLRLEMSQQLPSNESFGIEIVTNETKANYSTAVYGLSISIIMHRTLRNAVYCF